MNKPGVGESFDFSTEEIEAEVFSVTTNKNGEISDIDV